MRSWLPRRLSATRWRRPRRRPPSASQRGEDSRRPCRASFPWCRTRCGSRADRPRTGLRCSARRQSASRSRRSRATGRPEAPPQPVLPPEPAQRRRPTKPAAPVALSPPAAQKSELVIQIKPDATTRPHNLPAPAHARRSRRREETGAEGAQSESARPGPRTNKNSGVPFDPIKENGPIFVDWPKPKLALVITGNQEGYLEPCGCAGLDRMKGGMSRRYSLLPPASRKEAGRSSASTSATSPRVSANRPN